MVKAKCKSVRQGTTHRLETRHSLPLQDLGLKLSQLHCAKKCSSLTIPINPSQQTFLIPEEKHSRVGLIKLLPSAPEPERDVTPLQKHLSSKQGLKASGDICKKQRDLSALQAKLIKQQNDYIKLYAEVKQLEVNSGKDVSESSGDMRVVSVKGWPAHDLLMLVRDDAIVNKNAEVNGVIGPEVLHQMHSQLTTIPSEFVATCNELIEQRSKILEFFREKRIERNYFNSVEWKKKNADFDADRKRLQGLVAVRANHIKDKIKHCLHIAKISWTDRESLLNQLKQPAPAPAPAPLKEDTEKLDNLKEENKKLREQLNREREAHAALAELVASADAMISQARSRTLSSQRQVMAARAELEAAKRETANLKQYFTRRELTLNSRVRKLETECIAKQETTALLNCQRDALEIRVRELQKEASETKRNTDVRETQMRSQIKSLKMQLDEQERERKTMEAQIMSMEKRLKDLQDQKDLLQQSSTELIALQRKNCLDFVPKKQTYPTEEETAIWNDLQGTREALERVRIELERSRADKDGLLESLAKIAHEGPENKLAAELVIKEQTISRMRRVIEEKKENERKMEQTLSRYEDQLAALRLEIQMLRNQQCPGRAPENQLEEEVLCLCRRVETLNRERAALVSAVASRALMLERHERCAELFAQVTRTRRELAARLEGRRADPTSSVEISQQLFSATAEFWPSSQLVPERGCSQPLPSLDCPALEHIVRIRTAQLEQEIGEQCTQQETNDRTQDNHQKFLNTIAR